MQICNCAFLYQTVWVNIGLEWCTIQRIWWHIDDEQHFDDGTEMYVHIFQEFPWCQKFQSKIRREPFARPEDLIVEGSIYCNGWPNEDRDIQMLLGSRDNDDIMNLFCLLCWAHVHKQHQGKRNLCAWQWLWGSGWMTGGKKKVLRNVYLLEGTTGECKSYSEADRTHTSGCAEHSSKVC